MKRAVDPGDLERIRAALRRGWLITFPQGTTTPGAPLRKGTAHIIREHRPVVVPVALTGFDRAFDRKGFRRIGRDVSLGVRFGAPLAIGPEDSLERIQEILTDAIIPSVTPKRRFGPRFDANAAERDPRRGDPPEASRSA